MAKPDSKADVLLDAFSFALARYRRRHDRAWTVCWLVISFTYDLASHSL